MSAMIKEDLPGAYAPVLRVDLLARVHSLNLDYLELLAAEHELAGRAAQLQYFPPKLHPTFAELSQSQRERIASTPYALYSLCFEDVRFWRAACAPAKASLDVRYAASSSAWLQGPFCEVALIYAWQVASSHPLAARLVYSMTADVREILIDTPLWQIKRIANDYPGLLIPRWSRNAAFWPDLLRIPKLAVDHGGLMASQLLGLQLITADLIAATKREGCVGPFSGRRSSSVGQTGRHLRIRMR